jgi:hypothetical protein
MARAKLGEILIQQGVIDEATLKRALGEQIRFVSQRMRIGQILVDMRVCTLTQVSQALSTQLNVPYAALETIEPQVASLLTADLCERYQALPFGMESSWPEVVRVAFVDPMNPTSTEDVQKRLGKRIKIFIASPDVLKRKVAEAFGLVPPPEPQSTVVTPLELGLGSPGDAPMELEPVAIGGLADPSFVSGPDEAPLLGRTVTPAPIAGLMLEPAVAPALPPMPTVLPVLPPPMAAPVGPPVLTRAPTPLPMGELLADDAAEEKPAPRTARDAFEELFGPANTHLGSHDGHDDTPAAGVPVSPRGEPLRLTDLLPPPKTQTPSAHVHLFEDKRPKKVKPAPPPAAKPTLVLTTAALLGPDPSEVTVSELPTLTGDGQGEVLTGEVVADDPEPPPARDPLEHLFSTGNTGPQALVTPTAAKPPEPPAPAAVTPPPQPVVAAAPAEVVPAVAAPAVDVPAPAAAPVAAPAAPPEPALSLDDAWGNAFDAPAPLKIDPPKVAPRPKPVETETVDEVALDVELDTTDEDLKKAPPPAVADAPVLPPAEPKPEAGAPAAVPAAVPPEVKSPEVKPAAVPPEAFGEEPAGRKFTGEFEITPDLDVELASPATAPAQPAQPAPVAVAAPLVPPPAETPAVAALEEKAWSIEPTPARGSAAVAPAAAEVILDAVPLDATDAVVVDAIPIEVAPEAAAPAAAPAAHPSSDTGAFVMAIEEAPEAILDLTPENELPPAVPAPSPSPSSLSGSFERLVDRQLSDEELAIVKAIDALADGTIQESPIAQVKPAQMVAALVRLLIRKGIVSESDYLSELSRK